MTSGGIQPHADALYYSIATDALSEAQKAADELRRKQFITISLVFSALCLEAYVNSAYQEARLPYDPTRPLIKRLLELPALLNGEPFPHDSDLIRTVRELIDIRNHRLVHFKPEQKLRLSGVDYDSPFLDDIIGNLELAQKGVGTVKDIAAKIKCQ